MKNPVLDIIDELSEFSQVSKNKAKTEDDTLKKERLKSSSVAFDYAIKRLTQVVKKQETGQKKNDK